MQDDSHFLKSRSSYTLCIYASNNQVAVLTSRRRLGHHAELDQLRSEGFRFPVDLSRATCGLAICNCDVSLDQLVWQEVTQLVTNALAEQWSLGRRIEEELE